MNVVKLNHGPKADQKLELADNLFPDIMAGKKTDALSYGTTITLGYLELYSATNPANNAVVLVTGVSKDTIKKLASQLRKDAIALTAELKQQYPSITIDDRITVIEFMSPGDTAKLTDDAE